MEIIRKKEERKCPKCGETSGQMNNGHNRSGTQRRICSSCNATYTIKPKKHALLEKNLSNSLSKVLIEEIKKALNYFLITHTSYYRNFVIEQLQLKLDFDL